MFLKKRTLFAAFTAIAISGCVNTTSTANTEQQQITNLESSLSQSTITVQQTQAELASTVSALKLSDQKIATLTKALAESQSALTAATEAESEKKIVHVDDKTIFGQAEWVYVTAAKDNFKGRIDTGAATSSINAVDIERFERDGKKWVRFNLTHDEGEKADMIEARIIRIAKIVQSSEPDEETERPVVQLHVRIGDVSHLTEFTLTNRLHMKYPVLIGRSFMRDLILVDVSKEYSFPKYKAPVETK